VTCSEGVGGKPTSVFSVKTLISDKDRVFAKLETAVDVNSTSVEEVEDLEMTRALAKQRRMRAECGGRWHGSRR